MVRGISWGGTSLPITDASISSSREPVREQSMNGLGGEALYGGVYGAVQGSFSGACRSSITNLIKNMYADEPASVVVIVVDDNGNGLTGQGCYMTSGEISVKAGELAKVNCSYTGMKLVAGGTVSAADYSGEVPVFYNSTTSWGTCAGFSVKIDRPYAADDYIIGGDYYSQSIYQSGETSVSGTINLSQLSGIALTEPGSMTFTLDTISISVEEAVLSNAEMSISGRGLINKTFNWAAPSDSITIS